jgi:hypothetical protein
MIAFEDFQQELKFGLLLIADAVHHFGSWQTAIEFIGFSMDGETFAEEPVERVDLRRHQAMGAILLMYDFAFAPSSLEPSEDFEENCLASFISTVPQTACDGRATGWTGQFSRMVLDAFRARQRLIEGRQKRVEPFSIRELALLADMTEGAVRNSLSAERLSARGRKGRDGLEWKEAIRWLSQRRGFRSAPGAWEEQLPSTIDTASSLDELFIALINLGLEKEMPPSWISRTWEGSLGEIPAFAKSAGLEADQLAATMARLWIKEASSEEIPSPRPKRT